MSRHLSTKGQRYLSAQTSGDYFFLELAERRAGPLGVALGGREYCPQDYFVQRQSFPWVTIEYVAAGEGEVRIGDGPLEPLRAGSVYAYDPDQSLHLRTTGAPMTKYFVSLNGASAQAAVSSPVDLWCSCRHFGGHVEIREVFDILIREGQESMGNVGAVCLNLLQRLQLKLQQAQVVRGTAHDRSRRRFLDCKAAIDADPTGFASLDRLVRETGLNRPLIYSLFRRFQGVSPYQYIMRQRMQRAAHELMETNDLVRDVAARVGFADPLHFSRVFRKVHGISPAKLRRSVRD
jgi:AraC family transcriptional regulator